MKWKYAAVGSIALFPILVGCQGVGVGGFGQKDVRVNQLDGLEGLIESVHVETEIARQRVRDVLAMLDVVTGSERRGDPMVAFGDFVTSIDECEKQAEVLRDNVRPMMAGAETFFQEWEQELESYSSAQMRNLARTRMASTHQLYRAISQMVTPAGSLLDELNLRFRDCATFLSYDFNQASLQAIQEDVKDMQRMAGKLDKRFEASMKATQAYVESTRMPVGVEPADEPRDGR